MNALDHSAVSSLQMAGWHGHDALVSLLKAAALQCFKRSST